MNDRETQLIAEGDFSASYSTQKKWVLKVVTKIVHIYDIIYRIFHFHQSVTRNWRQRIVFRHIFLRQWKTSCEAWGLVWGRHNMPPPPASGDLNSHPELSAGRSPRMSVMRVIVLHSYIMFEAWMPSRSVDMADFRSVAWCPWTFHL